MSSELNMQNLVPNLNLEFKPNSHLIDTKTHTIETNVQTPNYHYVQNLLENHHTEEEINKQSFSVNPNKRGSMHAQGSDGFNLNNEEGNSFLLNFR